MAGWDVVCPRQGRLWRAFALLAEELGGQAVETEWEQQLFGSLQETAELASPENHARGRTSAPAAPSQHACPHRHPEQFPERRGAVVPPRRQAAKLELSNARLQTASDRASELEEEAAKLRAQVRSRRGTVAAVPPLPPPPPPPLPPHDVAHHRRRRMWHTAAPTACPTGLHLGSLPELGDC